MTRFVATAFIAVAGILGGGKCIASPVVEFAEVGRPSVEFMESGDFAGMNQDAMTLLGITPGVIVEITAPTGVSIAAETRLFGRKKSAIFLKKTLRDALNVEDGAVLTKVQALAWPSGNWDGKKVEFKEIVKPPEAFLDKGEAVGIGLAAFRKLNAQPGMKATLEGPKGTKTVELHLMERGPDVIAMKGALRNSIGVQEGWNTATLTMLKNESFVAAAANRPISAPGAAGWTNVSNAAAAARETNKPILILVEDERGFDSIVAFMNLLGVESVRPLATQFHLARLDPQAEPAVVKRLAGIKGPAIVIVDKTGNIEAKMDSLITAELVAATMKAVLRKHTPAAGTTAAPARRNDGDTEGD